MPTKSQKVKAFISYSHQDKVFGAQAKSVLAEVDIESFLAHEDLEVSAEWQARIIQELKACQIFVPLLSESFQFSKWAPQEVGFIVSRPRVAIAPISIDGTTSFGFIGHLQSRRIPATGISRELLVYPLAAKIPRLILPRLIRALAHAVSFRNAEALMEPLVPHFDRFTRKEAQAFAIACVENGQIWNANICQNEFLPEFMRIQKKNVGEKTLRALRYQVRYGRRFAEKRKKT